MSGAIIDIKMARHGIFKVQNRPQENEILKLDRSSRNGGKQLYFNWQASGYQKTQSHIDFQLFKFRGFSKRREKDLNSFLF